MTFEPLIDFKQNHYGSWNIIKAATFKFSSCKLLKHTITFFVAVLFNIFMRQTLTGDIWGLHKNMNLRFLYRVKVAHG